MRARLVLLLAAPWVAATTACGGGEPEAAVPIAHESAEDQILRLATIWESQEQDKGFKTPPSKIALFEAKITSRITFEHGKKSVTEKLAVAESFKTVGGASYTCETHATTAVALAFADKGGEPTVLVRRPALRLSRRCSAADFPEPILELPETTARFVLRGDQLVPLEPPDEQRIYLPVQ